MTGIVCPAARKFFRKRDPTPVIIILLIIAIIFIKRRKRDANMMFSVSERQKKAIFAPIKKQKNIFAKKNKRWFK